MIATNDLDTPTAERAGKSFATLAACYALHGMGLIKSDPDAEGQAPYYATRWGLLTPLDSLEAAGIYLASVAGNGRSLQAQ